MQGHTEGSGGRGLEQIGVLPDDQCRLAPKFQVNLLQGAGGLAEDRLPNLVRAGEGHQIDSRIFGEHGAHLRPAVDHTEHATGQSGLDYHFAQQQPGEGSELGRLDHHGIARQQGWHRLHHIEQEGIVVGRDAHHDAVGLMHHHTGGQNLAPRRVKGVGFEFDGRTVGLKLLGQADGVVDGFDGAIELGAVEQQLGRANLGDQQCLDACLARQDGSAHAFDGGDPLGHRQARPGSLVEGLARRSKYHFHFSTAS
ncbi:hypothetical protein D9M68_585190 [compost metagenome]